jgi:hypothetical protein
MVLRHQTLDWDLVFREAKRLGALGMVHVGLRAATELLGISIPSDILQKSYTGPNLDSLVVHVKECTLNGVGCKYSRPELLDASKFYSEIRERMRDRVGRSYIYLITPHLSDFSFVRLPRALFGLYYVVRPIRLVCKHGSMLMNKIMR